MNHKIIGLPASLDIAKSCLMEFKHNNNTSGIFMPLKSVLKIIQDASLRATLSPQLQDEIKNIELFLNKLITTIDKCTQYRDMMNEPNLPKDIYKIDTLVLKGQTVDTMEFPDLVFELQSLTKTDEPNLILQSINEAITKGIKISEYALYNSKIKNTIIIDETELHILNNNMVSTTALTLTTSTALKIIEELAKLGLRTSPLLDSLIDNSLTNLKLNPLFAQRLMNIFSLAITNKTIYQTLSNLNDCGILEKAFGSNSEVNWNKIKGLYPFDHFHQFSIEEHSIQTARMIQLIITISDNVLTSDSKNILETINPDKSNQEVIPYLNSLLPNEKDELSIYLKTDRFFILSELISLLPKNKRQNIATMNSLLLAIQQNNPVAVNHFLTDEESLYYIKDSMSLFSNFVQYIFLARISAKDEKTKNTMILAALLHDIGKCLGSANHEITGAKHLDTITSYFPEGIVNRNLLTSLVRGHRSFSQFNLPTAIDATKGSKNNPIFHLLVKAMSEEAAVGLLGIMLADRLSVGLSLDALSPASRLTINNDSLKIFAGVVSTNRNFNNQPTNPFERLIAYKMGPAFLYYNSDITQDAKGIACLALLSENNTNQVIVHFEERADGKNSLTFYAKDRANLAKDIHNFCESHHIQIDTRRFFTGSNGFVVDKVTISNNTPAETTQKLKDLITKNQPYVIEFEPLPQTSQKIQIKPINLFSYDIEDQSFMCMAYNGKHENQFLSQLLMLISALNLSVEYLQTGIDKTNSDTHYISLKIVPAENQTIEETKISLKSLFKELKN